MAGPFENLRKSVRHRILVSSDELTEILIAGMKAKGIDDPSPIQFQLVSSTGGLVDGGEIAWTTYEELKAHSQ